MESLQFSILTGGKPVKDLLEREITKVKDGNLILAIYEKMKEFWLHSKRKFDQTIMALFENEMMSRGIMHHQKQNQSHNHIHSHSHNQESSITNRGTSRDLNNEMKKIDQNEEKILERYSRLIKQSSLQTDREITSDNILRVFYEEQIGRVSPEVSVRLNEWLKFYPKSLILEALHCSRNAQKPISYANSIIENWKDKDVRTYKDVIRLDNAFNRWDE